MYHKTGWVGWGVYHKTGWVGWGVYHKTGWVGWGVYHKTGWVGWGVYHKTGLLVLSLFISTAGLFPPLPAGSPEHGKGTVEQHDHTCCTQEEELQFLRTH